MAMVSEKTSATAMRVNTSLLCFMIIPPYGVFSPYFDARTNSISLIYHDIMDRHHYNTY
jgi:hypothetical protein